MCKINLHETHVFGSSFIFFCEPHVLPLYTLSVLLSACNSYVHDVEFVLADYSIMAINVFFSEVSRHLFLSSMVL